MSLIILAMLSVVTETQEDTVFVLDQAPDENGVLDYSWRASIRGQELGRATVPLFDPCHGEVEFTVRRETATDAIAALNALLLRFYDETGRIREEPLQEQPATNERVTDYGPRVRVRSTFGLPPSCDLVVEWQMLDGFWKEVGRYNDMSNDNAHTDADALARATRKKLLEGETP